MSIILESSPFQNIFTSTSRSGANPAHVGAFVHDFLILFAIRLGVSFWIRQPASFAIGWRANLLQTSRPFPQRIARTLARSHVQTAPVVTHFTPAIAQPIRAFSGALFADFPVIPGRAVRRRSDGVSLGAVIADHIVTGVVPVGDLRTPYGRAP